MEKGFKISFFSFFILIVLLLAVFLLFKYESVQIVTNETESAMNSELSIEASEKIVFTVDSVTSPANIYYYETYEKESVTLLAFLNSEIRTIYLYDVKTHDLKERIHLDNFGYTSSDRIQGFHIINDDSLFVYNYNKAEIVLMSKNKGRLLRKSLVDYSSPSEQRVHPFVHTGAKIVYVPHSQKLFLTGFRSDEVPLKSIDSRKNVVACFNLKNGMIEYLVPYPSFYAGKNWGGASGLRQVFSTYNDKMNILLISFMADHSVITIEPTSKKITRIPASSTLIKSTRSMKYDPAYYELMKKGENYEYYLTGSNYTQIIYDKYRDRYYRIAEFPVNDADIDLYKRYWKPKSLIVLNSKFEKVGEIIIRDTNLDLASTFITNKGLYIKVNQENDNRLIFQLAKIYKNRP